MEQREETNAVRLYGQNDSVEDFPVLKAFQQYIDAEQTKARRRIVWLSVVFGFTTIMLVALFLFIISVISNKFENRILAFSNKNQELNDRLVEYAMKDRDRPRPQESDEGNKAALNVMKDAMTALQNQLAEQQKLLANEQRRNSEIVAAQAEGRAKIDAEREANEKARRANEAAMRESEAKMRESEAKIEKIRALLVAEKDKLAAEREKLKNEAKELHRQRLYPEYYAKKESAAQQPQQPAPAAKRQPPAPKPAPAAKPQPAQPPAEPQASLPAKKRKDGAIRYFDSDDDVEDTDSDSLWVIPE